MKAPGGKEYTLKLSQKFQVLEGTAERNGTTMPLSQARIRGDKVSLVIDDPEGAVRLEGRIEGDTMSGTGGAKARWSAQRTGAAPPLGEETDG